MLLLDNSASMQRVAARFEVTKSLDEFVGRHGADSHIAVIAFDANSRLLLPFTADDARGGRQIRAALQQLDYRGRSPDVTGGVEQALYQLINQADAGAGKSIVLITASVPASPARARWLTRSLVPAAVYNHVRVFSIVPAATSAAGELRQLALDSGGEFFTPRDAAELKSALHGVTAAVQHPASASAPLLPANLKLPSTALAQAGAPLSANFATPLTKPNPHASRMNWLWLVLVLAVLVAAAGIYAAWNTRGIKRPRKPAPASVPQADGPRAVLYDISNPNDIRRFELGERATLLGRVAGYDPEVQYILVKEKTVGRCHAVIERRGHSFWLMDQGSINGTFVNNERIIADRALKHGDIISIHRHEFEFMIPEYFESESTVVGAREQLAS